MKKALALILFLMLLACLMGCAASDSPEETNAKSILNLTQATDPSSEEPIDVEIKDISLVKTQKAYNNDYEYYLVETESNEWGYAELRNGEVLCFYVGYPRSEAETRCNDTAAYRLSNLGGLGE